MTPEMAAAFADELEKTAAPAILSRLRSIIPGRLQLGRKIWNSLPARAAAGGAGGAAIGAATADKDDRIAGAIKGGLLGAAGASAVPLVTRAGRQRAKESLARTYQAQKHGLTGRGPLPVKPGQTQAELAKLRRAQEAGLTSLPGTVRALVRRPKETLRRAWKGESGLGKALAVGDAAMSVPSIIDPNTEAGTAEKALGAIGSAGGYFVGSRMPLVGNLLFASGTGALGKYLGRGVDYATGLGGRKGGKKAVVGRGATAGTVLKAAPRMQQGVRQVAQAIHPQVGQLVK